MHNARPSPAPAWIRISAALIRQLPAGRYRIINQICRKTPPAFLMHMPSNLGGYSFICDLQDSKARDVCFTGRYGPQETALIQAILRPGMCFVDVGANWGYFTLLAAHLVGKSGRVISFEPDPRIFSMLQQNTKNNGLRQVATFEIAAADKSGTLTLQGFDESGDNWGLSRLVERAPLSAHTFKVTAQALDSLLDEQGVDAVDLLKMDIEGAEELALRGMKVGLAQHRYRRILLELHPAMLAERDRTVQDVLELLIQAGYRGWWVDHSHAMTRQLAYTRSPKPATFLRQANNSAELDAWPHMVWALPGLDPLP